MSTWPSTVSAARNFSSSCCGRPEADRALRLQAQLHAPLGAGLHRADPGPEVGGHGRRHRQQLGRRPAQHRARGAGGGDAVEGQQVARRRRRQGQDLPCRVDQGPPVAGRGGGGHRLALDDLMTTESGHRRSTEALRTHGRSATDPRRAPLVDVDHGLPEADARGRHQLLPGCAGGAHHVDPVDVQQGRAGGAPAADEQPADRARCPPGAGGAADPPPGGPRCDVGGCGGRWAV